MRINYLIKPICISACALLMVGCAVNPVTGKNEFKVPDAIKNTFDNDDPCSNNARNTGVAIGALAGMVIGNQLNHSNESRLLAAGIGAGIGGLIGHGIDDRRCALSKIAKKNGLTLVSATITPDKLDQKSANNGGNSSSIGLDVMVKNDGDEFEPGTSSMTQKAIKAYGEIADQYKPDASAANVDVKSKVAATNAAKSRKVLIVGHADDTGDSEKAAKLSEERAKAVAQIFASHGVPSSNIYYQGAGDTLPVASNATEKGSAENRRTQIVDVPSETDLKQYLSLRSSDPRHFSSVARNEAKPSLPPVPVVKAVVVKNDTHKHSRGNHGNISHHENTATSTEYDFGGKPDAGDDVIALGDSVEKSMFSLISTANADPLTIGSCRKDRPHIATSVKNLATGENLPVREALPGLYGAPITGTMNGNYIAIIGAYAPRDAGTPVPEPKFEVYRDYAQNHGRTPSFTREVPVNVYRGSNATLYRMFVGGQMECMDLVVPTKPVANKGDLYYRHGGQIYVAQGEFVARK